MESTPVWPTSPMLMTPWSWAAATERYKAYKAAINHHATTIGMRISATKSKVMSALIPGTQRQVGLLDDEPSRSVDKFKYVNSMFVANGQGSEEIRSRINLHRSTFSRQQSCLLPTPPRTWRRRTGGQLKMWETTIKAGLEYLSNLATHDGKSTWGG